MTLLARMIKFVVVPGALAAVGYFALGPRLGGEIVQKARTVMGDIARAPKSADPTAALGTPKNAGTSLDGPPEPEVKVTVRPYSAVKLSAPSEEDAPKPKKRRRRRRRTSTPSSTPSTPTAPAAEPSLPDPTAPTG